MIRYAATVEVARPAGEVFAAASDIARWGEWTDMRDVRHEGSGPIRVGSAGTFTFAKGPFRGPVRYVATQLEPGRRVEYDMTHPAFRWIAELHVEPDGERSRLATSGTFQLRGWWRLLQPLVAGELRRGEASEIDRLKAILEAGDTGTRTPASTNGAQRAAGGGA